MSRAGAVHSEFMLYMILGLGERRGRRRRRGPRALAAARAMKD
jgi:hypothetical protein